VKLIQVSLIFEKDEKMITAEHIPGKEDFRFIKVLKSNNQWEIDGKVYPRIIALMNLIDKFTQTGSIKAKDKIIANNK
jgi:hypothetical protein